jgi:ribose transport system permease protein
MDSARSVDSSVSRWVRLRSRIASQASERGVYVALFLVLVVTAALSPSFFQPANVLNVLRQASMLFMVSVGQLFVILSGGIDLSVGSVMTTATIITADITRGSDARLGLALLVCLVIGLAVAMLNILLILKRNVPPFIATLGTYILVDGLRLLYTRGVPQGTPPPFQRFLGSGTIGPIPTALILAAATALSGSMALRLSRFGRQVYATGSNQEAARLSGVPTERVVATCYILCSLLAVFAGIVLGGYIGYADRYLGRNFDLASISSVVVGGASFAGGVGTVEGTIAGILLITALSNILHILNVNATWQFVLQGSVIIAAVALHALVRRD